MNIYIAGGTTTKFGEHWDQTLFSLSQTVAQEAIADAGIAKQDIQGIFVANMLSGRLQKQDHLGAAIASALSFFVSSVKIEGACASGGLAVHAAVQALLSGLYETVLVLGVEKMTDFGSPQISAALMGAGSEEEREAGLTFPGLYALLAKGHMQEYGTTREHMAHVAVKNHYHASLNAKAQFPFEISIEKVLNSSKITDPLTLLDSSPITDGASAIILSTKKPSQTTSVSITASCVAVDTLGLAERDTLLELKATKQAAQKAYQMAGIAPTDIDVMEVHDCFTIAEIMAMEDLGFCAKGDGGHYIASGTTKLGGSCPVNTSGGLKGCGHPVGATGIKQLVEVRDQLLGRAGKRQVENAKIGLTHNVGGTGATVVVHVLEVS
jgi:acetyl-CoA C-acetyltransferase